MNFLLSVILILPLFARDIQVNISNIDTNLGGDIRVALFKKGEYFPHNKNPFRKGFVPANSKIKEMVFHSIPDGIYGIAIYHDENSNGEIDRYFFGKPKEGFGFSNNAKAIFSAPSFEDAKFSNNVQNIEINY